MKNNFIFLFILTFLLACASTPAPNRPKTGILISSTIFSFDELLSKFKFKRDNIGYIVKEVESEKISMAHNEEKLFIPASSQKILTAYIALEVLGPKYRFKTKLGIRGKIKDGILKGDLILKGGGDPWLDISDLMNLALRLKAIGVNKVEGHFILDDFNFGTQEQISPFFGTSDSYNTALGPLALEFNVLRLKVISKKDEDGHFFKRAFEFPRTNYVQLSHGDEGFLAKGPKKLESSEKWTLGEQDFWIGERKIPLKDPGLYAAFVFRKLAKAVAISLPRPYRKRAPIKTRWKLIHKSPTVLEIAGGLLEHSNNLSAELLLMNAMTKWKGPQQNILIAAANLKKWYIKKFGKIFEKMIIKNGSGLSPEAKISPAQMIKVLKRAESKLYNGRFFSTLLPISGLKGTLKRRLQIPKGAMMVWAKTGTLDYASALSGYFYSENGRKYMFSLFVTAESKRYTIDHRPNSTYAKLLRRQANDWVKRARSFQDELLHNWITNL